MTPHEQQTAADWLNYKAEKFPFKEGPVYSSDDMIAFAAFCLEKQGWKKYPEEKPVENGFYFVVWAKDESRTYYGHSYFDGKRFTDRASFISPLAWMPILEFKP